MKDWFWHKCCYSSCGPNQAAYFAIDHMRKSCLDTISNQTRKNLCYTRWVDNAGGLANNSVKH